MKTVLSLAQNAYIHILDLIFPEDCISCGKKGSALCHLCVQKIRASPDTASSDIFALFDYRDPIIKKAIWNIKYYRRSHLGKILGTLLYEGFTEELSDIAPYARDGVIWVMPIPLSTRRQKERGYNQAEKIAQGFCHSESATMLHLKNNILIKTLDTPAQAHITNRQRRLANIRNAFTVHSNQNLSGRTIILIDDVTTTGGTFNEAMSSLYKQGAKKVYGFAVAH